MRLPNSWPVQDVAHANIPTLTLPLARDALEWQLPHNIWETESLSGIRITHTCPGAASDGLACAAVSVLKTGADILSGFTWRRWLGVLDENTWLRRIILLETMTGMPGRFAEGLGASQPRRLLPGEHGWLRTLCGEAPKTRMHLSIALSIHQPRPLFSFMTKIGDRVLMHSFGVSFLTSPRFCQSFARYLEEEAVTAYTRLLEEMDAGRLPQLTSQKAPLAASKYYGLPPDASLCDVFRCIRADELLAR
eukprot:CAMPEP_0179137926 /NCGR_PEP_ID=MMETSP0796-20121207/65832_1 /TAXON_ID=73915 /ORGANISM="Pyrodinium bahamense, Strain pbaha01" /LENGTH=248 /DNA_ID=CAMNT_0020837153 /DNA_START=96 /DNA_END=842 /DNA_ORIENTATION=+